MNIKKMVIAALLAALCCAATLVIKIPSPMEGYMNLGDGFVLLSGWLLGPGYGFLAAGVGSALADLLSGYMIYVPGSFVIKGLMAFLCFVLLYPFERKKPVTNVVPLIISSAVAEIVMVAGYFVYAAIFMSYGWGAVASVPLNVLQGIIGAAVGILMYKICARIDVKGKFID